MKSGLRPLKTQANTLENFLKTGPARGRGARAEIRGRGPGLHIKRFFVCIGLKKSQQVDELQSLEYTNRQISPSCARFTMFLGILCSVLF